MCILRVRQKYRSQLAPTPLDGEIDSSQIDDGVGSVILKFLIIHVYDTYGSQWSDHYRREQWKNS